MIRFVFFAALLPLSGFAINHKEERTCPDGKRHYRTTIRHIESGGIGYKEMDIRPSKHFSPQIQVNGQLPPFLMPEAMFLITENGRPTQALD